MLTKAQRWAEDHSAEVLVADAQAVFGKDHFESAVRHALRAKESRTMVARSLSMEALRYLAGQRQVADAIREAGIRRGTKEIAIAVFGAESCDPLIRAMVWERDDGVLQASGKPFDRLGITKTEAESVSEERRGDLALERVALLDVLK